MPKKSVLIIILFFSGFTIINFYISERYFCKSPVTESNINRNDEQNKQNKINNIAYGTLYCPLSKLSIVGFEKYQHNELTVKLSKPVSNKWKIFTDEETPYHVEGEYPKINLLPAIHTYKILPVSSDHASGFPLILKIRYTPQNADTPIPGNYYLESSSIPIAQFQQFPVDIWEDFDQNNQKDIKSVRKILDEEAKIDPDSDTITKIEQLALFLLNQLDDKRGTPSKEVYSVSPFQQYQMAKNGESKVWCRQFMNIYAFFANASGITTRRIEVVDRIDGVLLTGHSFAESYIKEIEQWVFVDLTSKKIFLTNSNGNFFNTLDLYYINLIGSYEGITARIYENGKLKNVPYSTVSSSEQEYFKKGVAFSYNGKNGQKMCTVIPSRMASF